MKLLKFSGHSDDIFQCEFDGRVEEADAIDGFHQFIVQSPRGEGLFVFGQKFSARAKTDVGWRVGIAQFEEGRLLPSWPISYENSLNGYSPMLVIEAPDDVDVYAVRPIVFKPA